MKFCTKVEREVRKMFPEDLLQKPWEIPRSTFSHIESGFSQFGSKSSKYALEEFI
jgi:hypothetical protein